MDCQAVCEQQENSDGNLYNLQQPNNVFLLMLPPETQLIHPEMNLCDFDPIEQRNNSCTQSTTSLFSVDSSNSQAFPLYISSSLNTFHISNTVDGSFLNIPVTENIPNPPNNPADGLIAISDDDNSQQSQPAIISYPSENILDHQEIVGMGYVVPSPETSQSCYGHDLFKCSFEHSEHNKSKLSMSNEGEETADSPTNCTETSFYALESKSRTEMIPLLMPIQEAFPEISFPTNFSTRDENALSVDTFSNPYLSLIPIEDNVTTIALPQESILLLQEQMRKHVQLLTQMHLITAQQSALASVTEECRSMLKELLPLKQRMEIANLDEALDLVTYWETVVTKISPEILLKFERIVVTDGEKKTFFKRSCKHPQRYPFNPKMVDLMAQSHVFIFPELLPRLAIFQSEPGPCKMSLHEEQLIAMGMEQFTPFCTEHLNDDAKLPAIENFVNSMISLYMLPNWSPKQIATRIKNKSFKNKRTNNESNPIKYYRENKVAPPIHHVVQPFDRNTTVKLCDIPLPLLPERWQEEMNLLFTRKSRAATKRALEIFSPYQDQLETSTEFHKKINVQPLKRRRVLVDGID